eukprot:4970335-Pleurochrysis_carterae.AAC.6
MQQNLRDSSVVTESGPVRTTDSGASALPGDPPASPHHVFFCVAFKCVMQNSSKVFKEAVEVRATRSDIHAEVFDPDAGWVRSRRHAFCLEHARHLDEFERKRAPRHAEPRAPCSRGQKSRSCPVLQQREEVNAFFDVIDVYRGMACAEALASVPSSGKGIHVR